MKTQGLVIPWIGGCRLRELESRMQGVMLFVKSGFLKSWQVKVFEWKIWVPKKDSVELLEEK